MIGKNKNLSFDPTRPQNVKITKAPDVERVKISIIGEGGTGKTSIAKQYSDGTFESKYTPTIAVDYQTKTILVNNSQVNVIIVKLDLENR